MRASRLERISESGRSREGYDLEAPVREGARREPASRAATLPAPAWMGFFAVQDVVLLAYMALVRLLVALSEAGPVRDLCARRLEGAIAALLVGAVVARGVVAVPRLARAVLYRCTLAGVLVYNYLILRELLPLVRPDSLDGALLAIDHALFGVEPALWLERFNVLPVVEWFSFFYFSYFTIDLVYMLVFVWLARPGRATTEYALGTVVVYCVGHLVYMLVPGYGPVTYLADSFQGPVQGGFFWRLVWDTVQAEGAMKDIFPSLHTAVPTFYTLLAFRMAQRDARWRLPAAVTAFFAANIIFSTVFLRWHYAIDVVAGLALAVGAFLLVPLLVRLEEDWRERRGLPGVWSMR